MTESSFQTLGRYTIRAEIGRGGFATVYQALDVSLNREVALKVLHPQMSADRSFVERFRKEARTLASLRHPHIITVYEVSEVEGRLFIAMELAHGSSLAKAIADRKRFPWRDTLALLKPVCEALDYAHGQGVVHRDLKPANVLLDAERGPLLTDFGFARLLGDSSASMSLSGGILGTPPYIAPEVWELDTATPAADIYALGCIACEMLTGDVLFPGKTPMQSMRAHDRGPQFPATWPADVPPGVDAALQVALARKPENRYPKATTFWHALNDLEANAQATREQAERQAVADQWKAEAAAAMAAGEWSAAKMAVGRWLSITPDDPQAQAARSEIERQMQLEADRQHKQETERAGQVVLAAEAARRVEEERARQEAERKAREEQERQRQAELAAQTAAAEKAKRDAEERERQKQAREAARLAEEEARRKELAAAQQRARQEQVRQQPIAAQPIQRLPAQAPRKETSVPAPQAKSNRIWLYVTGGIVAVIAIVVVLASINPAPAPAPTQAPAVQPTAAPATQPTAAPAVQPTAAPAQPTAAPTAQPETPVPVVPKIARLNLGQGDVPSIDPARAVDTSSVQIAEETTVGLTRPDEVTNAVQPGMAAKWETSPDGRTYTFYLRSDVPWVKWDNAQQAVVTVQDCNGQDRLVNAHDFQYGILRTLAPKTAADYAYLLNFAIAGAEAYNNGTVADAGSVGVTVIDDFTLQVRFNQPGVFNASIIGMSMAHAQPRWLIEGDNCTQAVGDRWTETGFFQGYGPYTLKNWVHNSTLTLVKNPFWPGSEAVPQSRLEEITFTMLDEQQAFAQYEAGNLDIASVPLGELDRVKSDSALSQELSVEPMLCTYNYGFNTKAEFVGDARVRRALSMAIDRQGLIDNVLKGGQEPAQWFAPPGLAGAPTMADHSDLGIKFDPARAKAELDSYLQEKGLTADKVDITLMFNTSPAHQKIAEAIQQMWKQNLGLDVKLSDQQWSTYLKTTRDPKATPQIYRMGWCGDYPDANNFDREVFAKGSTYNPQGGGGINWDNPDFEQAVVQAAQEGDTQKRVELYAQAEDILVNQDAAIVPIYWYTRLAVTKPYVTRTFASGVSERFEKWDIDMAAQGTK